MKEQKFDNINLNEPTGTRRSGIQIMAKMIGLVKPLLHIMIAAIVLGVLGFLCAIFLTITAAKAMFPAFADGFLPTNFIVILIALAVLRGILHYGEQYCNHYIAFKLLALIRHKVFASLRKLCPAKLEGRDRGNLISIITNDIELLEVFYAHTISPIAIGAITSLIMAIYIGYYNWIAGLWAALGYIIIGLVIPMWNGNKTKETGMKFRSGMGNLNSFVLDSLRGIDETIQYSRGENRKDEMSIKSLQLSKIQRGLSKMEGNQRGMTNIAIYVFSFGMVFMMISFYLNGMVDSIAVINCIIAMMGSFGPVVALSSLSNNLNQTLASGERVLEILEEEPLVEEVSKEDGCEYNGMNDFTGAKAENVTFAYTEDSENILVNYNMNVPKNKILGIHGPSGCGKSTFLKLLMRFWDVNKGSVEVSGSNVKDIATDELRDTISFVTQDTHLFHDTLANNIAVGKIDATRDEIIEAAKKASIHDFIMSLPDGYDTKVGELGDTLSGGEKQRIGVARAFLHDAPLMLLDEPTSNLDSLNEGIILKSLKESSENKTVVMVSHRASTMNVADEIVDVTNTDRKS